MQTLVNSSQATERLIVGTGPAALAAAMAFRKRGVPFEVVDFGDDLEPEREQTIERLAQVKPDAWTEADRQFLFPPPVASSRGVEKRFAFGSDFPYAKAGPVEFSSDGCRVEVSHGRGGFGNVWGAAVLPFAASDTHDWPVSRHDLDQSFRELGGYVPISGEIDGLAERFPPHSDALGQLPHTPQSSFLLGQLRRRERSLAADGVSFGRARVAVDATGGANSCQRCGHCLEGCAYQSIFNPRTVWRKLAGEGVPLHGGYFAVEYREEGGLAILRCRDVKRGGERIFKTKRLFLGLGAVASTRLVAHSLQIHGRPIRLLDSQYFFFPWLTYQRRSTQSIDFTLAEAFLEILNQRISSRHVHFQVYGLNHIFRSAIRGMLPRPLRWAPLLRQVEDRFFLFQGFLPSDQSGHLLMNVNRTSPDEDSVRLTGVPNPEAAVAARRARGVIQRRLAGAGFVPPGSLEMVAIGRSFHLGGSFPMGAAHALYTSDVLGRPAGASRVHLLDASTFPSIPATTITLTIMANSDRVSRGTLDLEGVR